jgi:dienelactone hydrolase
VTRRELLAAAALARTVRAQTAPFRDYSRCLPDYLRGLADRAYRLRNSEIARLSTPAAIRERQQWVTRMFWKLVGGMPERTPLNARTVGSFEREGYRVEKVVYESQPNFHVSANLYVPAGGVGAAGRGAAGAGPAGRGGAAGTDPVGRSGAAGPPFPGVLVQMGHTLDGKAGYQRLCQGLARLGFLVLGFDPMGQGERTYYPGRTPSRSRIGADEEHTRPGRQMILKGDTATRLQTWDAVRSLDYLAAHPLVDPTRLASTGQSGGGTDTMLLAAVDDRLAAAAVSSGNTENFACASFNPPGSTDDAEQNLLASGPLGFDRWDLLYPLAPKPLLVLVSEHDSFGTYSPNYLSSGIEEFGKLKRVYERLGHADRIAWFGTPLPHGLSYDLRVQIYNWLARWLKGETKTIEAEPETNPEPEATLFVSDGGSMVQTFRGETAFSMNRKRAVTKTAEPLERLLNLDRPPQVKPATISRATFRNTSIEAVEFASAPGVWVPAWLFQPKRADASKPLVIVAEPARAAWQEGELYDQLAAQGCIVCAPDLRGLGDLAPEYPRAAARSAREHGNEESYAWASLILGKPLAGQRTTDLLAVVQGLRSHGRRMVLAARGHVTVPALFATALEPAIDAVYLAGGLASFQSIVDTEDYNHPFANFVPGMLLHTDLPDLMRAIAPRRVVMDADTAWSAEAILRA